MEYSDDILEIRHICINWQVEDITNLSEILSLPTSERSVVDIENKIKWLYHSKTKAQGKAAAKGVWAKITGGKANINLDSQFDNPTYEQILGGLLKRLSIESLNTSVKEQEEFLCDAVTGSIASGLWNGGCL